MNYPGLEAMARMQGTEIDADTFAKIQILERETVTVDREKHAEQNRRP